jgi:uncharacterized membrane protein YjjP (DUF1212 family)
MSKGHCQKLFQANICVFEIKKVKFKLLFEIRKFTLILIIGVFFGLPNFKLTTDIILEYFKYQN